MSVKFFIFVFVYFAVSSNADQPLTPQAPAEANVPNSVDGPTSTIKPEKASSGISVPSSSSDAQHKSTASSSSQLNDTMTASLTTSNPETTKQTNPLTQRDVSDCSTKFQDLTKNSALSPEKVILSSSLKAADDFCEQKKSAAALVSACSLSPIVDTDKGILSAANGISTMMTTLCDSKASSLKNLEDKETKCDSSIKQATKTCLPKSGVTSAVYPSDLMIMAMKESTVTIVCSTKICISSEIQKGDCSADQQKAILTALDSFIVCPAGTDNSTTTIPSATTTTQAGPIPTTKPGRNSASTIKMNVLIAILPVLALIFKF